MQKHWFLEIDYGTRRGLRSRTEDISECAIPARAASILSAWRVKSMTAINSKTGEARLLP